MIECDLCGKYFHPDDIEKCPECDKDLCPGCYEKHVTKCIAEKNNFDDEIEEESSIPYFCPNCRNKLELDVNPDGSERVYCLNCDFEQKLDESQIAELNQYEVDYSEDDISDNEDDE